MKEVELAWLSGLFDGEGSIALYPRILNGSRSGWDYFVQLSNTDPEVILKAARIIKRICFDKAPYIRQDKRRGNRMVCFCVVINSMGAIHKFLMTLLPYLVCKKSQAALMIEALENPLRRPEIDQSLRQLKVKNHDNSEETLAELRSQVLRND